MRTFHALAAVVALVILLRNAPGALRLLRPGPGAGEGERPGPGRLAGLVPLLACLLAAAVLAAAARGLLVAAPSPGAAP